MVADERQQHATAETAQETEQVCADVRVFVPGPRIHEQGQAADDRAVAIHPAFLRHQLRAPDIAGDDAERREHGRRCADRAMVRRKHEGIEEIPHRAGGDNGEPGDAGAEDAPGEQSEQRAEYQVAREVPQARVQRQGRHGAPDLAGAYEHAVDPAGAEPVLAERRLAGEPGDAADHQHVGGDAGHRVLVANGLLRLRHDGRVGLVVDRDFLDGVRRVLSRHDDHRAAGIVQHLVRNARRNEHEGPVGARRPVAALEHDAEVFIHRFGSRCRARRRSPRRCAP